MKTKFALFSVNPSLIDSSDMKLALIKMMNHLHTMSFVVYVNQGLVDFCEQHGIFYAAIDCGHPIDFLFFSPFSCDRDMIGRLNPSGLSVPIGMLMSSLEQFIYYHIALFAMNHHGHIDLMKDIPLEPLDESQPGLPGMEARASTSFAVLMRRTRILINKYSREFIDFNLRLSHLRNQIFQGANIMLMPGMMNYFQSCAAAFEQSIQLHFEGGGASDGGTIEQVESEGKPFVDPKYDDGDTDHVRENTGG